MREDTLAEIKNLTGVPQILATLVWVRQYFQEQSSPPPLLVQLDRFLSVVPCNLVITETVSTNDNSRQARIKIIDPHGQVRHEEMWWTFGPVDCT
jgi:hypothetical protein